jgi:serine/threonine protein kinase
MIGQTISHYRIVDKLGGGGMGVVYKAEDTQLGRFVALNSFLTNCLTTRRLLSVSDAKPGAASALNHRNICTIYEIGQHEAQSFIAMESLDGFPSFAQRIGVSPGCEPRTGCGSPPSTETRATPSLVTTATRLPSGEIVCGECFSSNT